MDQKEKEKHEVSDHGWVESCKKEKIMMKRSLLDSACKIAEADEESMAVETTPPAKNPSPPTMHECNICGKIFGSGKALGGHRRSHFQKQQHQKKVKVRFSNNIHSSPSSKPCGDRAKVNNCGDFDGGAGGGDDDGKRMCCICKKEFPTKNALFGHMRSHPDRSWRGVSPPLHDKNNSNNNSCSSLSSYSFSSSSSQNSDSMEKNIVEDVDDCVNDDCGVIDLLTFTSPSWLKTDVRGRKCIGGIEAAETLAYLSAYARYFCDGSGGNDGGDWSNRVSSPKKMDEVLPMSAPPPQTKHGKRKIGSGDESSSKKHHEVKKIKFCLKGELKIGRKKNDDGDYDYDYDDGEGGDELINRCKGLSESWVEKMSYMDDDDDEVVEEEEGFGDDVVNAEVVTVTTPVRVKDHVVDEKKVMKKVDQKGKNSSSSSKKPVLKSKAKDTENENQLEKVGGYKCGACGKVFTTFQGLGGHRSVHKEKNNVTNNNNTVTTMDESSNYSEVVAAVVADQENNSSSSSNIMQKIDEAAAAPLPATTDDATVVKNEAAAACESSGIKKLDFDLNELPCVMED